MDFLPPHKYLQWYPNTMEEVRRDVNLHRPGEMKEAVRILQEWIQQQPHFMKKDFTLHTLEMLIVMSKGSVEKAKKMIDGICTVKTLMPQFFMPCNPKLDFQTLWEKSYYALSTKLTADNCRIFFLRLVGKYDITKSSECINRHAFYIVDYLLMHDYVKSFIFIYDFREMDLMQTLKNYNLPDARKLFETLFESYKLRLKKFHIITSSKIIETIISFFKPFTKYKIMERVVVNKSPDELSTYYPKDVLPKDYGGDEKSIAELNEQFLDMISSKEHIELANSMVKSRVDESFRPQGQFGEMYAGTVGTFRSLNVD